jgi:hypothetical protein
MLPRQGSPILAYAARPFADDNQASGRGASVRSIYCSFRIQILRTDIFVGASSISIPMSPD